MTRLEAWPVEGLGEVVPGTDLASLLDGAGLRDGDVVLVTSKVVSKAEGRVAEEDRDTAVREETVRVVARRGGTRIVENPLGLVMAAAGVDASNVTPGHVVRLPLDPDGSARRLRDDLRARQGVVVAVVVTDTAGRAWRAGQTEIAVGVAGLAPLEPMSGATDSYGNPLLVTAPAVADELANVGELVTGKLGGRPVAVVRGLADRVLPATDHGPGARALLRPHGQDMFALGTREAVVAALSGTGAEHFGDPAAAEELRDALETCGVTSRTVAADVLVVDDPDVATGVVVRAVAHAHGWAAGPSEDGGDAMRLRPSRTAP